MVLNYFIFVCFLSVHLMAIEVHSCRIRMNTDIGNPQPILIVPGTENFVQPTSGTINMNAGDQIELFCSPSTLITATCQRSGLFQVGRSIQNFVNLKCRTDVVSTARRTGQLCYGGATQIEIGFEVSSTRFLRVMEICHNERIESTLYSSYTIPKDVLPYQYNPSRPMFQTGIFYGKRNIDRLYTFNSQYAYFSRLFGSTFARTFLDQSTGRFFSRGHLAAKSDFTLKPQQDSTFYFVNAAPQWQEFNGGNWESVEDSTRQLAHNRNLDLEIYTGTFGVLSLNHQLLYLNGNKIPIPEFYYRVVIDKLSRAGIVIVGVNDPYGGQGSNNNCKSNNIINGVSWLNWSSTSPNKGYLFACEFSHFTSFVPHLTSVTVNGILL